MSQQQKQQLLSTLTQYLSGQDNLKKVMNSPALDFHGKMLSRDGQKVFTAHNRFNRRNNRGGGRGRGRNNGNNQQNNSNQKGQKRNNKKNNRGGNVSITVYLYEAAASIKLIYLESI